MLALTAWTAFMARLTGGQLRPLFRRQQSQQLLLQPRMFQADPGSRLRCGIGQGAGLGVVVLGGSGQGAQLRVRLEGNFLLFVQQRFLGVSRGKYLVLLRLGQFDTAQERWYAFAAMVMAVMAHAGTRTGAGTKARARPLLRLDRQRRG